MLPLIPQETSSPENLFRTQQALTEPAAHLAESHGLGMVQGPTGEEGRNPPEVETENSFGSIECLG